MNKILSLVTLLSVVFLAACGGGGTLTEEQQAAEYGITVERFREEKKAAARMNMSIEEHMKLLDE